MLEFNPSTISRSCNIKSKNRPSKKFQARICALLGRELELLSLPHSDFTREIYSNSSGVAEIKYIKIKPRLSFASTEKWKHLWPGAVEKYKGSYFLYTKVLSIPNHYAVSLLRIVDLTPHGIEFDLYNVDNREVTSGNSIVYKYRGLVFPVNDVLNFFGEEESSDEMISLVSSTSQVSPPSNLKGHLIAVGVGPGMRMPSGSSLVLIFQTRKMLDVKSASRSLGVLSESELASRVVQLLK